MEKACLFPTGYGDKINEHLVGFMPCKASPAGRINQDNIKTESIWNWHHPIH